MAGSLSGIPLSQQFDSNGNLFKGTALLYIFNANTTTPQLMFQDVALTVPHVYPLPTDGNGRLPMFYLADGSVHARLQDSFGNILFDYPSILVIGPSAGAAPSGGVDPNAILATGDVKWRPTTESLAGWVRYNGRTIGSATSGASERANADVSALFNYLWLNFSDALCPVSGGRGANAPADFAANKTITLVDMKALGPIGLPDMGAADSGRLDNVTFAVGSKLVPCSRGGLGTFALAQAQFPSANFTVSGITLNAHDHFVLNTDQIANPGAPTNATYMVNWSGFTTGAASEARLFTSGTVPTLAKTSPTTSTIANQGTAASGGSGTPIQNMPPFITGTWYVRL